MADFRRNNFQVSDMSLTFNSHGSFDDLYKQITCLFAQEAISQIDFAKIKRLIILDDGGYLLHQISKMDIPVPVIGIEQTSAGYWYVEEHGCSFPVLNVARSKAKLELERPLITQSCLERIYHYIPKEELQGKRILILGGGTVGQGMKEHLPQADIYDPKTDTIDRYYLLIKQADVILGCSGRTSLQFRHYKFLRKGVKLISLSSSDREFEGHMFRREFRKTAQIHHNFTRNGITLFQSGFPINFWGTRNNIEVERIEITLALLQAAIYQAIEIRDLEQGIHSIDSESENMIMQEYKRSTISREARFARKVKHTIS